MVSDMRLILAAVADGPYKLIQEQTSKGQSLGNGLAGTVKEVKAKIRTLLCELEGGLGRTAPEKWRGLCSTRQNTVPKKNGQGRSTCSGTIRAPCQVDGNWQRRESDRRRGSLEGRHLLGTLALGKVRKTTSLEHQRVCGGCMVDQARARRMRLGCGMKGLSWDRKRRDPTTKVSMPRTLLQARVPVPTEPRAGGAGRQGGVPGPRWGYIRKNIEIRKYGQTPGCQGCLAIAMEKNRSSSHSSECRKRVESAMRAVGDERLEESKRRNSEVAPRPDVVMDQRSSSSGAAAGSGDVNGTQRTAEDDRLPSLQDLADSRPVQSAHGEMVRLVELSCETSEVAEVCPERHAESCRLFDVLPQVVLDLRTGWSLNEPAQRLFMMYDAADHVGIVSIFVDDCLICGYQANLKFLEGLQRLCQRNF